MLKRLILAASIALLPVFPALAENGCDGYCIQGRNHGRDNDRGHNRHDNRRDYGRHDYRPRPAPRLIVSVHRPYPYYYAPTRVVYASSPVIVQPQPQVIYINDSNSRAIASNDGRYCREYQAVAQVGGTRQQTYGTACMQPDGSWEIQS